MRKPPITLNHYFVPELSVSARTTFDPDQPPQAKAGEFRAEPTLNRMGNEESAENWQLTLEVSHQAAPEANFPYEFRVVIVGMFECLMVEERSLRMLRINGASILYGVAREIIREATARGPWGPIMLPTVSFTYSDDEETHPSESD